MLELSADQSRITFYDFDELFGQYESFNNFNMDAFAVPQDAQLPEFTDDYYYGYSDDQISYLGDYIEVYASVQGSSSFERVKEFYINSFLNGEYSYCPMSLSSSNSTTTVLEIESLTDERREFESSCSLFYDGLSI